MSEEHKGCNETTVEYDVKCHKARCDEIAALASACEVLWESMCRSQQIENTDTYRFQAINIQQSCLLALSATITILGNILCNWLKECGNEHPSD